MVCSTHDTASQSGAHQQRGCQHAHAHLLHELPPWPGLRHFIPAPARPRRVPDSISGQCVPLLRITHDSLVRPRRSNTQTGAAHVAPTLLCLLQPGLSADVQAHEAEQQHSQAAKVVAQRTVTRLWAGTHTKNSAVTARPLVVSSVASTGYSAIGMGVLSGVPGEACIISVVWIRGTLQRGSRWQHSTVRSVTQSREVSPTPAHHGGSDCGGQARAQSTLSACCLVLRIYQLTSCSAQSADPGPVTYTTCCAIWRLVSYTGFRESCLLQAGCPWQKPLFVRFCCGPWSHRARVRNQS